MNIRAFPFSRESAVYRGAGFSKPRNRSGQTTKIQIGFAAEDYILKQDKIQIELLCDLDKVPPVGAVIFCTFPKLKGGAGFPARCFAICPAE